MCWAWLPVQHIATLALPAVLPALSRLEKRCHQSATERLTKLAALRREPFFVAAGTIFGADGAATTLSLDDEAITDASIEMFACACAAGGLACVTKLRIGANQIGDDGMKSLSSALSMGALASVTILDLSSNKIGDTGMKAFSDACATGAMAQLQVSSLPSALNRCLETWHACSPCLTVSFVVPYMPYSGASPLWQPGWRCRCNGFGQRLRHGGAGRRLSPPSTSLGTRLVTTA